MADITVDTECNDPKELFGQGVRAYVLQDYESAVTALGKASELLVAEHKDDLHESLGEVYLYYGRALLGVSRDQNEALGDAVPKDQSESSDDEDEEQGEAMEAEDSEATNEKNNAEEQKKSEEKPDAQNEEKPQEPDDTPSEEAGSSKPGPGGDSGPSSSKEADVETTEDQKDEDASDLQLAWEVLELAKKIFEKQDNKKSLAETLVVLGEVSLESENFDSAIDDIKRGFEIQKEVFGDDSRTVAETLYKLGMAYATGSHVEEAINSYKSSLEYLQNRIKTLEGISNQTEEHKDEIEEIKSLVPEIEEKIVDMNTYKEEAAKKIAEAFMGTTKQNGSASSSSSTGNGAGSSKGATDISHLVKRKRKLEEDGKNEEAPAKKTAM